MDTLTTVFAVIFVMAIAMIGLQVIFATCYRPYALLKYQIAARRYASKPFGQRKHAA